MIKKIIKETIKEYDSEGKLIKQTITETTEDDDTVYYPIYQNPYSPIIKENESTHVFDTIKE